MAKRYSYYFRENSPFLDKKNRKIAFINHKKKQIKRDLVMNMKAQAHENESKNEIREVYTRPNFSASIYDTVDLYEPIATISYSRTKNRPDKEGSYFYKDDSVNYSKTRGIIFSLIIALLAVLAIFSGLFLIYRADDMPYTIIASPLEKDINYITDFITLEGRTDTSKLDILIDNKKLRSFDVSNNIINEKLYVNELEKGWHLISLTKSHVFSSSTDKTDLGFLHVLDGTSVYLSVDEVKRARAANDYIERSYVKDLTYYYKSYGRYFAYTTEQYTDIKSNTLRMDENGIPRVLINNEWIYNPTTVCQYAFGLYNEINRENPLKRDEFLKVASFLAEYQNLDGSFHYPYTFELRKGLFISDFVSGMAQGQLLSVYARAYYLTEDTKFKDAAEKALTFMMNKTDVDLADLSATINSLDSNLTLFDEYIMEPKPYVLNGILYGLVGLYDFSEIFSDSSFYTKALSSLLEATKAVSEIVPYYDFNGYSSYDLLPITTNDAYTPYYKSVYAHCCHIYLLHTLAEVTKGMVEDKVTDTLYEYFNLFKEYKNNHFYRQTTDLLQIDGKNYKIAERVKI